jgi:phosphopantetheinyl transferase (holo-ACP synthase)
MENTMAWGRPAAARRVELPNELETAALAAVWFGEGRAADGRAGNIAARTAAAAAAHVDPDSLEIVRRPRRAPGVVRLGGDGRIRELPISLSMSHRLGRAVAVAIPGRVRLGIDLEWRGAVPLGLERLYLSAAERPLLKRQDATTLWALKEAAWKALELDAAEPFHALQLVCDEAGVLRALRHGGGETEARAHLWSPWPRFVAALVWLP